MSLEYNINLAVLNLPDSIDIIDFFSHILKAFYWEYDDFGRKPFGLDHYVIHGTPDKWNKNFIKIKILARTYEGRFPDNVVINGEICKGKVNEVGGYSLSFTVEERAKFLYERITDEQIKMLRQYFSEHLGLTEVKICEVTSFRDID